jgi:hypothetical protein
MLYDKNKYNNFVTVKSGKIHKTVLQPKTQIAHKTAKIVDL